MPLQKFENVTVKVSKHRGERFSTAEVKLQDGSEHVSCQSQSSPSLSPSKLKWRTETQLQKRIEAIRDYFNKGFTHDEILALLEKYNDIRMSIATLKRRMGEYGEEYRLRRRFNSR